MTPEEQQTTLTVGFWLPHLSPACAHPYIHTQAHICTTPTYTYKIYFSALLDIPYIHCIFLLDFPRKLSAMDHNKFLLNVACFLFFFSASYELIPIIP